VDEIKAKSPNANKFESGLVFSVERDMTTGLSRLKKIRGISLLPP